MAEFSSFFKSIGKDRRYKADKFAEYFHSFLTDGVFPQDDGLQLQVTADGSDMNIAVNTGKAWIQGYYYSNTTSKELTLTPSDATNDRIDRIVARVDLNDDYRSVKVYVKTGTSAETPTAPTLTRELYTGALQYEIALADVYVAANATVIENADITDQRLNEDVCGIVNSLIQVPTATFESQFTAWFESKTNATTGEYPIEWDAWFEGKTNETDGEFYTEWKNFYDTITSQSPNFTKYAIDSSSTANQINISLTGVTGYSDGFTLVNVKVANANTDLTYININSIGNKEVKLNGKSIKKDTLLANSIYSFVYNSTLDCFELFRLGGGGAIESTTNKLTTASTTWDAAAVSELVMSTVCVETTNMTAGSIDIEIDGVVIDTVLYTDATYTNYYGATSTIKLITSSDFAGSSYCNVKFGSGVKQELAVLDAVDEFVKVNVTENTFAEITVDGRNGTGGIEVDADGIKTDYQIANELLEKIKAGFSSSVRITSKKYDFVDGSTYDNKFFSVASQETYPISLTFNADYTKFYVLGYGNDKIFQYTMGSTDISGSTYDNKFFSVASQETYPSSLTFNADYTKFYVLGYGNDKIFQYTMGSTDISGSTYDNKFFSVESQETSPYSLTFNADYTKFYVLGSASKKIYQYTMGSTNISGSVYDNKSFSVTTEDTVPSSLTFNADYKKFYVLGNASKKIYQYTMGSTNISNSVYDKKFFSVESQETSPYSLTFNADYTKFYVLGSASKKIYQYTFGEDFSGETYISIEY